MKELKNETTGELEKYMVIKISEDEKNDYFLEIKIPQDYVQESWERLSKDNALVMEFVPQDTYKTGFTANFRITIELYPKRSMNEYLKWRKDYMKLNFNVYRSSLAYISEPPPFPESAVTIQETLCKPRLGIICLPQQKEINIMKVYKGKTTFWTVEYAKVISGRLSDLERKEVVLAAETLMENCCKIKVVGKVDKSLKE